MKFELLFVSLLLLFISCNHEQSNPAIDSIEKTEVKTEFLDAVKINYLEIPEIDKVIFSRLSPNLEDNEKLLYKYYLVDTVIVPWLTVEVYSKLHPSLSKYFGMFEKANEIRMYNNNKLIDKFQLANVGSLYLLDEPRRLKSIDSTIIDSLIKYSTEIEEINYQFNDVNLLRKVANYCTSNNIALKDNSLYDPKWSKFEGEFVFGYSGHPSNRNDDSIFQLIHSQISDNKIDITHPNVASSKDSAIWTYRAYCDDSIYNLFIHKFNNFDNISNFMKLKPKIQIIGNKNQHLKINNIIKTWANKS
jgi:hypothetical protein